jgi:hypothetical protein
VSDYADYAPEKDPAPVSRRQLGPTSYVLIGLLVGLILGIALIWGLRGNPFSSANEVVYTEVVVGSVTSQADQICWSEDPERRDAGQTCAILALDPALDVPAEGDLVTIGLVDFRTPDGAEFSQVVHVAPVEGGIGSDVSPSPPEPLEEPTG